MTSSATRRDDTDPPSGAPDSEHARVVERLAELVAVIAPRPEGGISPTERILLDSLPALEVNSLIELEFGVSLPLETLLGQCTLESLADAVVARQGANRSESQTRTSALVHDPDRRYEPFELTDVQRAYLLGHSMDFELGGRSTHMYLELDVTGITVEDLDRALPRLIEHHDMLRAVVLPDGRQQVLPSVPPYQLKSADLTGLEPDEVTRRLGLAREAMNHQDFDPSRWPLYDIRAHSLPGGRVRIHLSMDLLLADADSIRMFVAEWLTLAADPARAIPPPAITFRDYAEAARAAEDSPAFERARDYWLARLDSLPPGPDLPRTDANPAGPPRFVRHQARLDSATWEHLQARARASGLTPSALLCAAYVEVLRTWSANQSFTLNVTLGDRPRWHPDLSRVLGDFTSTVLLECDARPGDDFAARADRLQRQLRSDLDHRAFGGVRVLRELAQRGASARAYAPVVFTSVMHPGAVPDMPEAVSVDAAFAVSQTPQVLLDHQIVLQGDELFMSWDATEDLFPPGLIDDMFGAYQALLRQLADDDRSIWRPVTGLVPEAQLALQERVNDTRLDMPAELLQAGFERQVAQRAGAPAVIAPDRVLTYEELDRRSAQIAHRLRELGARPNELVAVVMEKGWEQVAAVLGILRAGSAYIPIDAALPPARVEHLLERSEATIALTQRSVAASGDGAVQWLAVDDDSVWSGDPVAPPEPVQSPEDLAYVIFTSGSTGEPKGVMIDHRGAANTVRDVNQRFGVGPGDRVLALSSLGFDLSVYDVFGILGAGGAIVLPARTQERDPESWRQLVEQHGVTIWNTVPALLELLVEHVERREDALPAELRLALMSGDWIPVTLPDRIRAVTRGNPELMSLGGATEASIWSIAYPIGDVDPAWPSIPYGRAMANQTFYVLDEELEPRPTHVQGDLYIGGVGVALGYWRDAVRTAERFITHPDTGERLYRTGDLGRYLPSGDIEFLGRSDFQVQVNGYRVELGEIESVLARHPSVVAAAVVARGERDGPKRLLGYVVTDGEAADTEALRAFLAERLPTYMVPQTMVKLDALPLTGNGKVDRDALPDPAAQRPAGQEAEPSRTPTEAALAEIMQEVLGVERVGRTDSFFDLGGDSLLGVRMLARAGEAGLWLSPDELYAHPTVAELAALARTTPPADAPQGPVTGPVGLTPSQQWFLGWDIADVHHWNGMWPIFEFDNPLDVDALRIALEELLLHHDALRLRFHRDGEGWQATIAGPETAADAAVTTVDLTAVPDDGVEAALERDVAERHASLDLENGPVIRLTYYDLGPERHPRLLVSAHWLVLDYYASRVFFEDLRTAYFQVEAGTEVVLPPKTASLPQCVERLEQAAASDELLSEVTTWQVPDPPRLPVDLDGDNLQGSAQRLQVMLSDEVATAVLNELPRRTGAEVRDILLTALLKAVTDWSGERSMLVELEGIGRESVFAGLDVTRSIGRFSTLAPVLLERGEGLDPEDELRAVRYALRAIPNHGIGYGLLRYLHPDESVRRSMAEVPPPEIGFNYWGDVSEYYSEDARPTLEAFGPHRAPTGRRTRLIDFMALAMNGTLMFVWTYGAEVHHEKTITALSDRFLDELRVLAGTDALVAS